MRTMKSFSVQQSGSVNGIGFPEFYIKAENLDKAVEKLKANGIKGGVSVSETFPLLGGPGHESGRFYL